MRRIARRNSLIDGAGWSLALLMLASGCSKKQPAQPSSSHPTPTPFIPRKAYDTARIFNGITLKSSVEATQSDHTSLHLEPIPDSYELQLDLHLQVPKPAVTATDLLAATPELGGLLPDLDQLLQNATASPDFAALFDHKEKNLRANLGVLQKLLPRDTLYDCQTILNLQHPRSFRTALLVQALMNVNSDGSDGDRNLDTEKNSAFFQPQTNYRWRKKTERPNPCLQDTERHLAQIEEKLLNKDSLKDSEKTSLEASRVDTKEMLQELKHWSFLVGTSDPFIVLPSFMFSSTKGHPEIGDYAIVIARDTLYPAIVGDKGPSFKMGEASLRICREIDRRSTSDSRPIDHPTVAYLVFPGTAEKPFAVPDYQHWSERCHELWKEFGGSDSASWHTWDSLEKPWPTPTPSPSPNLTPAATPTPSIFQIQTPSWDLSSPLDQGSLSDPLHPISMVGLPLGAYSAAFQVSHFNPSAKSSNSPTLSTNSFPFATPSPITGTNPASIQTTSPQTHPASSLSHPTTPQ